MLPVLKNADCKRVRKNKEMRASDNVKERNVDDANDAGSDAAPFPSAVTFPFEC